MAKIFTEKFIIFFKDNSVLSSIDIPSLKFLIDDCDSLDISTIVPEDLLAFVTISNDMSTLKYNVSLLIKYIISNPSFRENIILRDQINNLKNSSSIPFLGYFTFLYENIDKIQKKYKRGFSDTTYIYLSDINYLD